ncbi:MAG TPA: hypothetical protein V6D17_09265 [Candidatus Obscuribacterales bacterium]
MLVNSLKSPLGTLAKLSLVIVFLLMLSAGDALASEPAPRSKQARANERLFALMKKGQIDEVLKITNAELRHHPQRAVLYFYRAQALQRRKETLHLALKDIDKAIELDPDYALYHMWKSTILSDQEEDKRALPEALRACQLEPKTALYWDNLSVVQRHLGKSEDAIRSADKAVQFSPQTGLFRQNRARALQAASRFREALEECNRAVKLRPASKGLRTVRANIASHLNQWDTVISDTSFCLAGSESKLHSRDLLRLRASAYAGKKQYERAIHDYEAAVKLFPYDRESQANLKAMYLKVGSLKSAQAQEKILKDLDDDVRPFR